MTTLILFFCGCWLLNEIIHYRAKVAKADAEAARIAHDLGMIALHGGEMIIKKGAAKDKDINGVIEALDDLMMVTGKTCKITIED